MKCIHELFETQAEQAPDSTAIVFDASSLTYDELNRRADNLAHRLNEFGVGPDTLVALYVERSFDMIVGLLGILKAGGAYVPLDPSHPRERLAYMLADAQPAVLLTQARLKSGLPTHTAQVVAIDDEILPPEPAISPAVRVEPHNLAYVIYTSGSTGEPKGVEVEHSSVVNMLESMRRRPGFAVQDAMLAITTLAFDIAAVEIFLPLTCGGRVVIAASDVVNDGPALAELISRSGVTVMQATPATLRMLLDAGWQGASGLKILCGGEAWATDLADGLLSRCSSLWNMYGPTETTVWSAVAKVEVGQPIAIGRPIANTRFYVLDGGLQLVPVGVAGELFIGGDGLARGYLGRPELTRERFVSDGYVGQPGARMYRTGDLVRRQRDGTLEFLGRLDHQVKIRGHRIELGEIEARLWSYPGVREAVVLVREDRPGDKRLVGYYTTAGDVPGLAELHSHLGTTLPGYMIPAAFVRLGQLPLTANGKLDRKALPAPEGAAYATTAYEAPLGPVETAIAEIWAEILGVDRFGRHDNFFDLGGHSLLAVRSVGEINKTLKQRVTVAEFFQNPTIEQLTQVLEQPHELGTAPRVLPVQQGRSGIPIYFMGAGPTEYRIADEIGDDRAIFVIDAPLPEKWQHAMNTQNLDALPTIEELGAFYGGALYSHVGMSPCVIAGYSLGGKIAFEAARALDLAGGKVVCVLLLDAFAFTWSGATRGPGWHSLRSILHGWIHRAAEGKSHVALGPLLGDLCRLAQWLLGRMPKLIMNRIRPASRISRPSGFLDREGLPIDQELIDRLVHIRGRTWRPHPVGTPGVLFRARNQNEVLPGYDFTNGWRDLFLRGVEIVNSAGDHFSMVTGDNLKTLTQQIAEILDRHEASWSTAVSAPREEEVQVDCEV